MGDFFQHGGIATLHQFGRVDLAPLETKIALHAQKRPISLILPCQYADLAGDAWRRIRDHLMHIGYLRRIVVGLDQAKAEEFGRIQDQFAHLPQETQVVWTGSPAMESLCSQLWAEGFLEATGGNGRALWMCIGYILACRDTEVIVVHDCDILTYDRLLLGRLAYPLVVPDMEYDFAKGYAEGIVFSDNQLRTIRADYHRTAEDMVRVYEDDAAINGLSFDRHADMRAVQSFLSGLEIARQNFIQEPISHTSLTECPR